MLRESGCVGEGPESLGAVPFSPCWGSGSRCCCSWGSSFSSCAGCSREVTRIFSLTKSRAKLSSPAKKTTFEGRGRRGGGQAGASRDHRVPQGATEVSEAGREDPQGRAADGSDRHGQDLARAGRCRRGSVPFFSVSGSDFVEMFVGIGASRVRDLFEQGKKNAPCIVFIDEIDAVGRHRGAGLGGGHDEREQTLNHLLVEMDGFETNEGVIVLAATNRPDVLDPALLRPGRFDRRSWSTGPMCAAARRSSRFTCAKCPWPTDVELSLVARGTPGFSGADLANLVNEAALHGARYNREAVTQDRSRGGQGQGADGCRAPVAGHQRRRETRRGLPRGRPCAGRPPAAGGRSHCTR